MFTPGLVSVSFRELSPREVLETMKTAGLCHVEWGSDVHAPYDDPERLAEIVQLQKEYGVNCCSYGTYFRLGQNDLCELPQYIAAAKTLGTNVLRLWCGTKGSADYTSAEEAEFHALCRQAAKIAEEHDVIFCMECHPKSMTDDREHALRLMQAVNSPKFRMYWQPHQRKTVEENLQYAADIAPYAYHLHVFQWYCKEKFPLLCGEKVWKKYLSCFPGDHFALLEFMPDDDPKTLPQEADALRKIIGEKL